MEHVVYILYSRDFKKSYVGSTTSIISRFHSHNKLATKGWTIRFRPWEVVHLEFFETKKEAYQREMWFKSGIGREYKAIVIRRFLNTTPNK